MVMRGAVQSDCLDLSPSSALMGCGHGQTPSSLTVSFLVEITTTLLGCPADFQSGHPPGHTMTQDTPRPHCDPGHCSSHTKTQADWHPALGTGFCAITQHLSQVFLCPTF